MGQTSLREGTNVSSRWDERPFPKRRSLLPREIAPRPSVMSRHEAPLWIQPPPFFPSCINSISHVQSLSQLLPTVRHLRHRHHDLAVSRRLGDHPPKPHPCVALSAGGGGHVALCLPAQRPRLPNARQHLRPRQAPLFPPRHETHYFGLCFLLHHTLRVGWCTLSCDGTLEAHRYAARHLLSGALCHDARVQPFLPLGHSAHRLRLLAV